MPDRDKPSGDKVRIRTDGSLSVERQKADDALSTSTQSTERTADHEVEVARAGIDKSVARDRAKSSLSLETDGAFSDQVQDERRRADAHTAFERDLADRTLQKERQERRFEQHAFFADQRIRTDRCLRFERSRTDQASALAAQLLAAEQKAHDASKNAITSRDEFLAIVSHDLRSPLGVISMCADALLEMDAEPKLTPEQRQFVDIVQRQVTSMNRLIVDLLDVEHMVSGELKISRALCDLPLLVGEAVESFQVWASKQQITLTAEVPEETFSALIDRDRMWQVLSNLIGNALKFTPEGGTVAVSVKRREDSLQLTISDTGQGIAEAQKTQIFERFSQLKKNDRRGVGLGLFISKWIVEAHAGRIWVDSTVDVGSHFHVAIPLKAVLPA